MYCLCEEYTIIEVLWKRHMFGRIYCYFTYTFRLFVDLHNQFEPTTAQNCVKKLSFSNVGMYKSNISIV